MASPPRCIANLVVNETSSSVTVRPSRGRSRVLTARGQGRRQKLSPKLSGFGRPARPRNKSETPREVSAGRRQRARLRRGRNFLDSSIPRGSTEPTSRGRVCQSDLTVANFFANGKKRLTEQIFPLHWRGSLALGSSARRPIPHTGSRGLASANR